MTWNSKDLRPCVNRSLESNPLHVVIFRSFFISSREHSIDSSKTVGNFLEVLNLNQLFLKLNWFISDYQLVLSVHCFPKWFCGTYLYREKSRPYEVFPSIVAILCCNPQYKDTITRPQLMKLHCWALTLSHAVLFEASPTLDALARLHCCTTCPKEFKSDDWWRRPSCTYNIYDFKVIRCMLNDMTFLCGMHERNIQLDFLFFYFYFCQSQHMLIVERNFIWDWYKTLVWMFLSYGTMS